MRWFKTTPVDYPLVLCRSEMQVQHGSTGSSVQSLRKAMRYGIAFVSGDSGNKTSSKFTQVVDRI